MKTLLKGLLTATSIGAGGVAVVLGLHFTPLAGLWAASTQASESPRLKVEPTMINRDFKAGASFAPVARKVTPSVVNIYSTMTIREERNPLLEDPFFRRFFGNDGDDAFSPRERKAQGLGSGVIVSEDGYILTANHVVEGADRVKVALSSEREFDARVVGTDPPTDLAVLKIEVGTNLPAATLADSDKLEVGDVVLAIGNPFGVGQTVTMGIVSGLSRGGFGINAYENFIQTDAAINQGNSGGALIDAEGRVVGINTAILSRTGGNMGVGFAVPINMSRYVMDRIIQHGKVTRGYLGINIQPLTPGLAKKLGLPEDSSGVLVGGVSADSPAKKAGLQNGDVILELNGKKMSDPRMLSLMVAQTAPGSKVHLSILHSQRGQPPVQKTITATLAELPQELTDIRGSTRQLGRAPSSSSTDALSGVEVMDLSPAVGRDAKVPRDLRGALVTRVAPGSNAAEAGLRPGDVIVEIDRQPVRSAEDVARLTERGSGDALLLSVWTHTGDETGGTRYLEVEPAKPSRKSK